MRRWTRRQRLHQSGRSRSHVGSLTGCRKAPQVVCIAQGNLPERLSRVRPERDHQLPQVADGLNAFQDIQSFAAHRVRQLSVGGRPSLVIPLSA
jgi:hypothetical protein